MGQFVKFPVGFASSSFALMYFTVKVILPPALQQSTVEVEGNIHHIDQSCVVKYTKHSLGELKLGKTSGRCAVSYNDTYRT